MGSPQGCAAAAGHAAHATPGCGRVSGPAAHRLSPPPVALPTLLPPTHPHPPSAGPGLWLPSPFRHLLLAWLILGVLVYTFGLILWFWVMGYERCCDGSVVYAFIGGRVEAFSSWFRPFAIAASSAMLVAIPLLITAMFALKQALELPPGRHSAPGRHDSVWRRFVLWSGKHRALCDGTGHVSNTLFVLPLLAFSIAGTELTLYWNGITGVYSLAGTGQLVPLLVGVGALLKAFYFAWAERPKRDPPTGLVGSQQHQQTCTNLV